MPLNALADPRFEAVAVVRQRAAADCPDEILEPVAQSHPAAAPAEQLEKASIVQDEPILGVPQSEALGHRLGRMEQAVARGLQGGEVLGQPVDHAVEGAADARHLVTPVDLDPYRGVAPGHLVRREREPGEPARQDESPAEPDQRDQHHADHGDADAEGARLTVGLDQRTLRELDREAPEMAGMAVDLHRAPISQVFVGEVGKR
jgi:hypothetical protein